MSGDGQRPLSGGVEMSGTEWRVLSTVHLRVRLGNVTWTSLRGGRKGEKKQRARGRSAASGSPSRGSRPRDSTSGTPCPANRALASGS